jgi:hypothetical protein
LFFSFFWVFVFQNKKNFCMWGGFFYFWGGGGGGGGVVEGKQVKRYLLTPCLK